MSRSQHRRPTLAAAVEVFARRGYAETTLDDLLPATGLDADSFNARFAGEEGCFLAAYRRIVAVAQGQLAAAVPRDDPWPDRAAAGLLCLFELIEANPAPARFALLESPWAGPAALDRHLATLDSLTPFIVEGRACCEHPDQLPAVVDSVLPGGIASAVRGQLQRRQPVLDLYPELLRFLLLPYLGELETSAYLAAVERALRIAADPTDPAPPDRPSPSLRSPDAPRPRRLPDAEDR
jgi:AcrR family transcriptional regulator